MTSSRFAVKCAQTKHICVSYILKLIQTLPLLPNKPPAPRGIGLVCILFINEMIDFFP